MTDFNPYTDFKLPPGAFGGSSFESSWKPDSDSWNKAFNSKTDYSDFGKYTDPFGFNKDKDKKESPWGDVFRFAGDKLGQYAQNRYGQSGRSDGLVAGGGGGVSQSGDLTIVDPQSPTVIPGQKGGLGSTIGSIAGAALGTLIAPGIGTTIGGQLGGAVGGAIG